MNFTDNEYPKEWECPITKEIMRIPVMANDGITYEKEAIEKWLSTSSKSPITGVTINRESLTINYALKNTIEQMVFNKIESGINSSHWSSSAVNLSLSASKFKYKDDNYLKIKVNTSEKGEAKETLVLSLVDVSGSMDTEVSNENDDEQHGFSRLDLVKHSLKTIIKSCTDKVELCLIPFSETAHVLMNPTKMIETEKSKACDFVDSLQPTNTTNIWDALRLALEISKNPTHSNKNIFILLFTDGVPNVNPPRGISETLKNSLKTFKLNGTINTFGFGYGLDSSLLRDISDIGFGSYSFIPDATMVGTVFVNFIANSLLTCATNKVLKIKAGGFEKNINIGSMQYGQSKDFMVMIPNTDIEVSMDNLSSNISKDSEFAPENEEFYYQYCRIKIVELIKSLLDKNTNSSHQSISESMDLVDSLHQILNYNFSGSEKISELLKDLKSDSDNEGQILKSVSRLDWYNRWGKHYLLSIQNAHILQQCNNFRDPGVQLYGGQSFNELRDQIEEIFCKLPPPKPTARSYGYNYRSAGSNTRSHVAPTNMSSYMNSSGVCFNGDANIKMEDGSCKKVSDLVKGDLVIGGFKIKCIVKTKVEGKIEMVNIDSLLITPWHPILSNDKWVFPIKECFSTHVDIDYIYNIVLETGHIVILNGISVVTLGHGFTTNEVVKHDYYGTNKVIEDLKKLDGWDEGLVNLDKPLVSRGSNGHVVGIQSN